MSLLHIDLCYMLYSETIATAITNLNTFKVTHFLNENIGIVYVILHFLHPDFIERLHLKF